MLKSRFYGAALMGLLAVAVPLAGCSTVGGGTTNLQAADDENAIQVGVLVFRDIEGTRRQYEPLLSYLSEQIGRPFVFVPLTNNSQFLEVERGQVDFVFTNPLAAVQMQRIYDTEFIATRSLPNTGTEFGGQIVVKSDSSIQSIADLRGKRGGCVSLETAAAGCLFQMLHVQQSGIDPFLEFESLKEIPSQNTIVQQVVNGEIDFGFVRTGQLEQMVQQGQLNDVSQLRVLDPQSSDHPFEHTTRLYPDWPVTATATATPEIVEAVRQTLLNMSPDHPALEAANIEGFVETVDYAALNVLIEELQLKSWDAQ